MNDSSLGELRRLDFEILGLLTRLSSTTTALRAGFEMIKKTDGNTEDKLEAIGQVLREVETKFQEEIQSLFEKIGNELQK